MIQSARHDGPDICTPSCRPVLLAQSVVGLGAWLGTLSYLFVLCVTNAKSNGICTTWGCHPTFDWLPLFHAAWLLALVPPAWFAASVGPPKLACRITTVALVLGIGASIYDTVQWAMKMAERGVHVPLMDYVQRWAYRLATSVMDLPLLAIVVAATLAWIIAQRRVSRLTKPSD